MKVPLSIPRERIVVQFPGISTLHRFLKCFDSALIFLGQAVRPELSKFCV
jgi:hypothetical protein